jgi:hypothetical protein
MHDWQSKRISPPTGVEPVSFAEGPQIIGSSMLQESVAKNEGSSGMFPAGPFRPTKYFAKSYDHKERIGRYTTRWAQSRCTNGLLRPEP